MRVEEKLYVRGESKENINLIKKTEPAENPQNIDKKSQYIDFKQGQTVNKTEDKLNKKQISK